MQKLTFSLLAVLGLVGTSFAGREMVSHKEMKQVAPPEHCFNDRELQFDIFGAYSDGNGQNHAGIFQDNAFGGGIGINYFFHRNLGVGLDATWLYGEENPQVDKDNETTLHNFTGSLIFRFPIDSACIAPYLFVGGGFHVDGEQWASGHAGGGLEYRIVPQKVGIFVDARYTYFGDRFGYGDQSQVGARAGVRVVF